MERQKQSPQSPQSARCTPPNDAQPELEPEPEDDGLDGMLDTDRIGPEAEIFRQGMEDKLIGQPEAVRHLLGMYQQWIAGMTEPGHPIGNILLLGPTGVGKTRCVEAMAETVLGSAKAVLRVDCGEFQHGHEIAKLIGSPPGYLGHRETHPMLSQELLNQHHTDKVKISFVLFDEIEKASDALWNLLLGIMDKATMTLGDNRKVDFSRAIVFMTGNVGAADVSKAMCGTGFAPSLQTSAANTIGKMTHAAARRKFTPEFMNRVDKVIVFNSLGPAEIERILTLELNAVQQLVFSGASTTPFVFTVTGEARTAILKQGIDRKYGARYLKRAIARMLTGPLSNLISSGQLKGGDMVEVGARTDQAGEDKLSFRLLSSGTPAHQLLSAAQSQAVSQPAPSYVRRNQRTGKV